MEPSPLTAGTLYLVATPIGNLEDITLRALRVLRECDVVSAEDTRRSGQLLRHFGIQKPLLSCFQFNEAKRSEEIIERLRRGEKVALVTDAGSPGISDPGERVVRAAIAAGLRVEPVPGPSALVAALTASGLPTAEFHFVGFLPHKSGQRRKRLEGLKGVPGVLVAELLRSPTSAGCSAAALPATSATHIAITENVARLLRMATDYARRARRSRGDPPGGIPAANGARRPLCPAPGLSRPAAW